MSNEATMPSPTAPLPRRGIDSERAAASIAGAAATVARGAAAAAKQRPKDALRWFSIVTMVGLGLAFIWASFFSPWTAPKTEIGLGPMNVEEFRRAFRDVFDARDAKVIPATDPTLISLTRGVENLATEVRDMKTASATERNEIRKEMREQNIRIDRVLELVTKPPR